MSVVKCMERKQYVVGNDSGYEIIVSVVQVHQDSVTLEFRDRDGNIVKVGDPSDYDYRHTRMPPKQPARRARRVRRSGKGKDGV